MVRANARLRFEREGPLLAVGLLWTQEAGGWRRHVIRRHRDAQDLLFSELFFVVQGRHFCLRCLSQNVRETTGLLTAEPGVPAVQVWYDCDDCGLRWREVPEIGRAHV